MLFPENDHHKLPRLYHLDNYDRCLSQPEGLYCLGTFRLSANKPNAAYKFLKEYSSEPRHFDRTLLHRGYCLSSRCPSTERNATRRFERCVETHALEPGLNATVQTYHCTRPEQQEETDIPQRAFLIVVYVLLFLNVVGTLYDYIAQGQGKNKVIIAWSMRANWQRLTTLHEDIDPRLAALAPVQGIRVLLLSLVLLAHASEILHKVYLYNPEFFEQVLLHPATMLIRNGSSLVQSFVVLSNFLFAYSLLLHSKQRQFKYSHFPLFVLHRMARLSPMHLLAVGFAATWWARSGAGPQWAATVRAESLVCRKKFWAHALYLHNFVHSDEHCLLQTWFLAVDMQLYIVASLLMLYLMQRKKNPIPLLILLFFLSCLLNAGLAYINEWKSLLYIMVPENVRNTFRGIPSFNQFYIAPWGSLPACIIGLLTAYIHYYMQEQGYKVTKHKWFVCLVHWSVPLQVGWVLTGHAMPRHATRATAAWHVALERPIFALLGAVTLLGFANNVDNRFHRLAAWRGWAPLGRASLAVLLLHWLVNMRLAAARHTLSEVSVFTIGADLLSTGWWTCLAALPLTLLVESPMKQSFNVLLNYYL
ncbi:unnamed protein product [Euphydryas editha]|uniref:Acyltransferase 3 domain-containing protein n=1 Tax=Euphydryas editha TaxID=104508 RepID=A0AAU9U5K0_EUPED|nr:unnamed protein product [Euphydryas editha]